jgi:hypothetical protein
MELSLDIYVVTVPGDDFWLDRRASVCLVDVPISVLTIIESAGGWRVKLKKTRRVEKRQCR